MGQAGIAFFFSPLPWIELFTINNLKIYGKHQPGREHLHNELRPTECCSQPLHIGRRNEKVLPSDERHHKYEYPFIRRTDFTQLKGLHHKLKQFIVALQHLSTHKWGSSVAEIQNACGAYMMQSNIDKKTLMKTNNEIGQHLQFIMQLAGDMTP